MHPLSSVSTWISQLKAGDAAVADRLWQRYYTQLVARLLAKQPAGRPQTPAEVADALAAFTTIAPPGIEVPRPPRQPRRRLLVAAGCAALALIVVGVIVIIRDKQGKPIVQTEVDERVVRGGEVQVLDPKTGKTERIKIPPGQPNPPPLPQQKARVTVTEQTGG